ncbi:MAG: thioredoxin domain-containing protein [Bacteroidetes bacterium]|nr:thioredoxin domain-containing protein [Bacteroidota bacterium]
MWGEKWLPDNTIDVKERMMQHSQWIKESNIAFTPTVFINGRKLPGRYSLNDLEILMPQLAEIMTEKTSA